MSKPITIPFTFQTQAGPIPLSELDTNFGTGATAINDFATYSNYLTDTSGAPNQITVTIPVGTTFAYAAGVSLQVLLANTNTSTAVQINVSGLGNKAVQNNDGSVPAVGQLIAGMILQLQFNGTVFLMTGASSKAAAISGVTSITGTANQIAASASTGAVTLSLPQNVIIPQPASGVALTVNVLDATEAVKLVGSASVSGYYIGFHDASAIRGYVGLGPVIFTGAAETDFGIASASGTLRFSANNGNSTQLSISNAGGLFTNGATGGDQGSGTLNATGLFVNGVTVGSGMQVASKAALTARTTNSILVDPDLTLALVAGRYKVNLFVLISGGVGGISASIQFTGTATSSGEVHERVLNATYTAPIGISILTASGSSPSSATVTASDWIRYEAFIVVSVAGNVQLFWGQNTTNASATNVLAGSYMTAVKVG